jgi:hypothetical protein
MLINIFCMYTLSYVAVTRDVKLHKITKEPRQGLKEFLSKLNEAGFKIVVNSTRTAKSIYGWLDEHNLRIFVDLVTDTKPPAVAYIDDRGICFRGNFDEVFEQLLKFKAFWEK